MLVYSLRAAVLNPLDVDFPLNLGGALLSGSGF